MGSLLGVLLSYLLLYKYATLFVVVFAAAIVLPLPSNAMLLAVGAFASQGYFNLFVSLAVAIGANVAGDLVDFFLAKRYGGRIIRVLRMDRSRFFSQLQEEIKSDAGLTVFTSRFAGSLGPIVSVLAGSAGIKFLIFLFNDFAGNGIETTVMLLLGFSLGNYWQNFSGAVNIATGIVVVAVLFFVLFRISRRITRRGL